MSAAGTASKHEPRVPDGVDVTRPSIARIYDYVLYGKDNFAVDRAAAEKLMESRLDPRRLALANRAFLFRAVRFLAQLAGLVALVVDQVPFVEADDERPALLLDEIGKR